MNSLFFNFIRRAIIFPVIVVVIIVLLISFGANRQVSRTNVDYTANSAEISIDDFSPKEYNSFSEIKEGRYVCTSKIGNFESAVLYGSLEGQSEITNLFYMNSTSTEPWNNGCVKIMSDSWNQMNRLLDVRIGDSIQCQFYHGDENLETDVTECSYKVIAIENGKSAKYISKYQNADTLLVCASYDNIADKNQSFYYVIVAERED